MKTVTFPIPHPPRFDNEEDAKLFMECVKRRVPFPEDKIILPYELVDGVARVTKRYKEAPFELSYVYGPAEVVCIYDE